MAWYDEAVFYHIYPLGLTGAPKTNSYGKPEHRLNTLQPWIGHIREIGCNALYIGPLFESVGHGYETTDYKKLDSRLGTNEDLTAFVEECHRQGIRVILDGVFNHTGRDFFAFQDIKKNRENSPYKDWYCNVNFWGNNEYNDGFSYENWGGYDLLIKLNQHNPAVKEYICDVIRFWANEFKIDGIRLDAADVLDFGYMQALRQTANEIGPDFWLMGEVIHGDYTRWVNEGTLHSVTNYHLHKALYSGHNDHNYFEIAHTVRRLYEMGGNRPDGLKLYNFVDNHDVERIYTKLTNKAHFVPVHILLYTLPGVPSVYYGSEFGIEGKKERYSDDSLRPSLSLKDYESALEDNVCTRLIAGLGKVRQRVKALSYGDYKELVLTNRQYGFARNYCGESVLVAVNNDENEAAMSLPASNVPQYREMLSGETANVTDGHINIRIPACSGGIWVPAGGDVKTESAEETLAADKEVLVLSRPVKPAESEKYPQGKPAEPKPVKDNGMKQTQKEPVKSAIWEKQDNVKKAEPEKTGSKKPGNRQKEKMEKTASETGTKEKITADKKAIPAEPKPYEEMDIEELQQAILDRMAKNGPVTDRMRQDVMENVYHDSLVNWIKSFR
ncbi:MAG: alpha-amylase [Hungatella sp.]|nr:alpha-amylase [Hungatella sp.]